MQNLVVLDVPRARLADVLRSVDVAGLPLGVSAFARGTVACTGTEFCKLALTETKSFAARLVEELEARLPGFDEHVKIHVTGCPNSCGQHWIADIGIEGKKVKVDGRLVDAYYFCVGGAVGRHQAVARPIGRPEAFHVVCHGCEGVLKVEVTARDLKTATASGRHSATT